MDEFKAFLRTLYREAIGAPQYNAVRWLTEHVNGARLRKLPATKITGGLLDTIHGIDRGADHALRLYFGEKGDAGRAHPAVTTFLQD